MTTYAFPALGFDPAPGDSEELQALSHSCSGFAVDLDDDATRVQDLAQGAVWSGPASDAFRHRLDDLPQDLHRAGDAYRQASAAVARFAAALDQCQLEATSLERQAEAHERDHQRALASTSADDPKVLQALEELDRVRAQAHRLREQVRQEAARCGAALQDATRHAPHPPGWFHRLVDAGTHAVAAVNQAVGDFVRAHAKEIAVFADVLSKISSVLSVVAMLASPIPVLGTAVASLAGTGALICAGGALLGHTALAAYAGGSWGAVVFDAFAVVSGVGPKGVEAVAGRVAASKGMALGETAMGAGAALTTLLKPGTAITAMAKAELTFPQLLTKTVSYQFELGAGGLGVVDLGGGAPKQPEEAEERWREAEASS